jgi:dephospho-CoA kinase
VAGTENKYIIGLTGNIAVGKSVVRRMIQHLGAYTIDADGLTHQAMMPGAPGYKPVVEAFGRFILDPNGQINRQKLGAIAFAVPEALTTLEAIIHPIVGGAVGTLVGRATQSVIVVEAIKLLEGNLAAMCNSIWVVDAPPDAQLRRMLEKRTMDEAEARRRIAAQNPQAEKLKRANVIINNGGDVDQTWKQVQSAWDNLFKPATPAPTATNVATAPAVQIAPLPSSARKTSTDEATVVGDIRAKRGTPGNAEQIANFLNQYGGKNVSRMDIMLAFGQKSYIMAQNPEGQVVAVAGWQVENLITSLDELYIVPGAPREQVVQALIADIEKSGSALQSEVCFVFLPKGGDDVVHQSFSAQGYQPLATDQLKFPAWREAASSMMNDNVIALMRQLRTDRVMKPI